MQSLISIPVISVQFYAQRSKAINNANILTLFECITQLVRQ